MAFEQDEFPCKNCSRRIERCVYSDEHGWDWDTDDVCPGFRQKDD